MLHHAPFQVMPKSPFLLWYAKSFMAFLTTMRNTLSLLVSYIHTCSPSSHRIWSTGISLHCGQSECQLADCLRCAAVWPTSRRLPGAAGYRIDAEQVRMALLPSHDVLDCFLCCLRLVAAIACGPSCQRSSSTWRLMLQSGNAPQWPHPRAITSRYERLKLRCKARESRTRETNSRSTLHRERYLVRTWLTACGTIILHVCNHCHNILTEKRESARRVVRRQAPRLEYQAPLHELQTL